MYSTRGISYILKLIEGRTAVTLKIDQSAYDFILEKGGVCTIRPFTVKNCCGGVPVPDIRFDRPEKDAKLVPLVQDKVTVFVSRMLRFADDVVALKLNKVLFFRGLEFPTLRLLD
jgi:hypothetical protein